MLDKEMDVAFIIRHVRILRYFLRTVLDKDQRVLLKLKSTEFIPSSDDERKAIKGERKHKRKELILQRYVENLQKKQLEKKDIRLLEVLGFKEALKILTDQKRNQLERDAIMEKNAGLKGALHKVDEVVESRQNYEFVALGATSGNLSETKTRRNPEAGE